MSIKVKGFYFKGQYFNVNLYFEIVEINNPKKYSILNVNHIKYLKYNLKLALNERFV